MSASGFVIAILQCSTPDACETTALRAVRYQSLEQCQAAIPGVLDIAARRRPGQVGSPGGMELAAQCRSLAGLCPARVARAPVSIIH